MHEVDGVFAGDALLETLWRITGEGLLMCDAVGRVVHANAAALRITGHTLETMSEQNLLDSQWNHMAQEDERGRYGEGDGPLARTIRDGSEYMNIAIKVKVRDDERILSINCSPLPMAGDARVGAIVTIRDITEEGRHTQLQRESLSLLAHELRAPLTVIGGYSQIIMRRLIKKGLPEDANIVQLIEKQVSRLSSMISHMVEAGTLDDTNRLPAVERQLPSQQIGHVAMLDGEY
jgi:PAS domain S-box-containing protein